MTAGWPAQTIDDAIFSAVDTAALSFCSPSRGPTSTTVTFRPLKRLRGIGVIAAR